MTKTFSVNDITLSSTQVIKAIESCELNKSARPIHTELTHKMKRYIVEKLLSTVTHACDEHAESLHRDTLDKIIWWDEKQNNAFMDVNVFTFIFVGRLTEEHYAQLTDKECNPIMHRASVASAKVGYNYEKNRKVLPVTKVVNEVNGSNSENTKCICNLIRGLQSTIVVLYVPVHHEFHYYMLKDAQSLTSCMTHSPRSYDTGARCPVEAYDYADNEVLALPIVIPHNKCMAEKDYCLTFFLEYIDKQLSAGVYPFAGRAICLIESESNRDHDVIVSPRFYGDERVEAVLYTMDFMQNLELNPNTLLMTTSQHRNALMRHSVSNKAGDFCAELDLGNPLNPLYGMEFDANDCFLDEDEYLMPYIDNDNKVTIDDARRVITVVDDDYDEGMKLIPQYNEGKVYVRKGDYKCECCDEWVDEDNVVTAYDEDGYECLVCDDCCESEYHWVQSCSEFHHRDNCTGRLSDGEYHLQDGDEVIELTTGDYSLIDDTVYLSDYSQCAGEYTCINPECDSYDEYYDAVLVYVPEEQEEQYFLQYEVDKCDEIKLMPPMYQSDCYDCEYIYYNGDHDYAIELLDNKAIVPTECAQDNGMLFTDRDYDYTVNTCHEFTTTLETMDDDDLAQSAWSLDMVIYYAHTMLNEDIVTMARSTLASRAERTIYADGDVKLSHYCARVIKRVALALSQEEPDTNDDEVVNMSQTYVSGAFVKAMFADWRVLPSHVYYSLAFAIASDTGATTLGIMRNLGPHTGELLGITPTDFIVSKFVKGRERDLTKITSRFLQYKSAVEVMNRTRTLQDSFLTGDIFTTYDKFIADLDTVFIELHHKYSKTAPKAVLTPPIRLERCVYKYKSTEKYDYKRLSLKRGYEMKISQSNMDFGVAFDGLVLVFSVGELSLFTNFMDTNNSFGFTDFIEV